MRSEDIAEICDTIQNLKAEFVRLGLQAPTALAVTRETASRIRAYVWDPKRGASGDVTQYRQGSQAPSGWCATIMGVDIIMDTRP